MKVARVVILTVFAVIFIVFGLQNLTRVPLKIVFGKPLNVGLTYIIAVSFAVGFMGSIVTGALIKSGSGEF